MARWSRVGTLASLALLTVHSCTCRPDAPESTPPISERQGFSASLPTAKRERPESAEQRPTMTMGVTPLPPALPTPADSPTVRVVELPEDFPKDVPVFENAEAFAVQNMAHDGHTVLFRVDAEATKIFSFYRDTMQTEGWNVSQEYQAKGQSFLSFSKGNMITNVTVAKDPKTGKQVVAVMYYEEKPLPFPEF